MEDCITITDAKFLNGYRLDLAFSDGRRGTVDLKDRIIGRGGLYEALTDAAYFRSGRVDAELGTVVWPNGLDICPDLLYGMALGHPLAAALPSGR
jgi:hypothetical protein